MQRSIVVITFIFSLTIGFLVNAKLDFSTFLSFEKTVNNNISAAITYDHSLKEKLEVLNQQVEEQEEKIQILKLQCSLATFFVALCYIVIVQAEPRF